MIEIIQAIAMLCQVHTGEDGIGAPGHAMAVQQTCQKKLAVCVQQRKESYYAERLLLCVEQP